MHLRPPFSLQFVFLLTAGCSVGPTVSPSTQSRALDAPFAGRICPTANWCWDSPRPQGEDLFATFVFSPNDVWAAGANGTAIHFDGSAWKLVPTGTTAAIRALWGSAPNALFAVGDEGMILFWNGSDWKAQTAGGGTTWFRSRGLRRMMCTRRV